MTKSRLALNANTTVIDLACNKGVKCKTEGCDREATRRGLCHKHHQWLWNNGLLDPTPTITMSELLDKNSEPIPECGCILWTAAVNNNGYGVLGKKRGLNYAHRISYEIHVGTIPDGMHILHKCDTPRCINPNHMSLGTHQDNMADMVKKSRHVHGERAWKSKVTSEQVLAIRSSTKTRKELAEQYGMTEGGIGCILRRENWKHI